MCKLCETKPVYEFTNQRKLCKICFIRWFEKKFLYTIRKFKMIQPKDVVGYGVSGTQSNFRGIVLEELLKMLTRRTLIELVKLPTNTPRVYPERFSEKIFTKGKEVNKIAIASTTDLEADKIVHFLIKGKNKTTSVVEGGIIKPLYLFLDKEVLLYAKLKGLKSKKVDVVSNDEISKFINKMEEKHPEIKRAVVKSYLMR